MTARRAAPILPSDPEAERSLLSACLESAEVALAIVEDLEPDAFWDSGRRAVFEAVRYLATAGDAIDKTTVLRRLHESGADRGTFTALEEAIGAGVPANSASYARIMLDLLYARRLLRIAGEMLEEGSNGSRPDRLQELARAITDLPAPRRSSGGFAPVALDWTALSAQGLPQVRWIEHPYIPEAARVWVAGPAGSGKTVWAQWLCARLSREGLHVAYYSQENPLAEDVRRLERLQPDWGRFRFFHHQLSPVLDLADPEHVRGVMTDAENDGSALIVFDTFTACWSGDENDNAALAAFDRDVLSAIVRETGAATIVLDHTGHPQAFVRRSGVSAPRGASAKGQKTDVLLEFKTESSHRFRIEQGKARVGGQVAPPATFEVIDTDDGSLDIIHVKGAEELSIEALASKMVEAVEAAGFLTTRALREAAGGAKGLQKAAMRLLEMEEPARLRVRMEVVETVRGGRQRAKVWRTAADTGDTLGLL